MSELIHCEHLSFSYEGENARDSIPALRDINLSVSSGEYIAVLGHNGSGKSTLAKLFNLILTPTSGKLIINGKDVSAEDFTEDDLFDIRRRVGMVFQNPDNQMVATVVEEDVAFGPENLGVPRPELRRRVAEALEAVGMTAYAAHDTHKLSGGQKQRVAIAGILAMQPECIIFDEATAMLDPQGRHEVIATIEKLNRERGMTVVLITHYMEEAARAGRVVVVSDGEVKMDGTPREIFARAEELRSIGLEVPQGTELLCELRTAGLDLPAVALTAEECIEVLVPILEKK